jgi:hypothetical protein
MPWTSEVALGEAVVVHQKISRLHVQAPTGAPSSRSSRLSMMLWKLITYSLPFSREPGAQKQLTSETGLSCIQCALNRASFPLAQEEGGLHRAFPCRSHFARRTSFLFLLIVRDSPNHCVTPTPVPLIIYPADHRPGFVASVRH